MREVSINTTTDQLIIDCLNAFWAFRMMTPHLVFQKVRVSYVSCCHYQKSSKSKQSIH